jgi:hypothetical protein
MPLRVIRKGRQREVQRGKGKRGREGQNGKKVGEGTNPLEEGTKVGRWEGREGGGAEERIQEDFEYKIKWL